MEEKRIMLKSQLDQYDKDYLDEFFSEEQLNFMRDYKKNKRERIAREQEAMEKDY